MEGGRNLPIPQSFLDELTARCPIEEVVADYVTLTAKGGNLWGLCPFHAEKTPSFSVSPDKHIFHCFGCGKGGGVIRFVMEMESLSFPEAVRKLAARAGLEMPEEDQEAQRRRAHRRRLLELNRAAARFYYETLKTPQGAPMLRYAQEKRRLTPAYIKRFGLGAAPDAWDSLIHAMAAQGYEKGELLEAGLAVAGKNGGVYDKFRNRLMLPVIDAAGDILGFTSRVMDDSAPKYLNTPETALFKKRGILYGINFAKLTKRGFLLLVEGNLDVITLHQAGIDNAVATMGTALTIDHARLIGRYTHDLVLCYDNDAAGVEATQRAMTVLRDTDFNVRVLQLPRRRTESGELVKQDPDDFIKFQGPAAFERLLAGSEDQTVYRLEVVAGKHDLTSNEGKVAYFKDIIPVLAGLPSAVEREIYAARVAKEVDISKESILHEVERHRKGQVRQARRKEERAALTPTANIQPKDRALRYENPRSARAEEGVIRLLFLDPTLLKLCGDLTPESFSVPLWGRLFGLIRDRGEEGVSPAALDGELTAGESDWLARMLQEPQSLAEGRQAMADYMEIIRAEAAKRLGPAEDPVADLLAIQAKGKQKLEREDTK